MGGAAAQGRDETGRSAENGGDVSATPAAAVKPAPRQIKGRLVIATHNPGKLREMREMLSPYGTDAVSAGELGLGEPEEPGTSFRENARIKAMAAAEATSLPAFADDSGLAGMRSTARRASTRRAG